MRCTMAPGRITYRRFYCTKQINGRRGRKKGSALRLPEIITPSDTELLTLNGALLVGDDQSAKPSGDSRFIIAFILK